MPIESLTPPTESSTAPTKFSKPIGSILGSTALVAGTTVGAGMLALPSVTQPAGLLPSTLALIGVWLYALISGLLIAEVNLQFVGENPEETPGLLAMIARILGKPGAIVTGIAYLFLHYALLVAYVAEGGGILLSALRQLGLGLSWSDGIGQGLFTAIFGGLLYLGRVQLVERLNSLFVAIVVATFLGLLICSVGQVEITQFARYDWGAVRPAIPVMLVALFYHNVIPVIVKQLKGDVVRVRRSITFGSALPMLMFLIWNAVVLGSAATMGSDPLAVLRSGQSGIGLAALVSVFSEFAIVTSFIGFVYGLVDFWRDLLKRQPGEEPQRLPLYSLVLGPAFGLSVLNPQIFLVALAYAGTFSISVIGGMIPAVMAGKRRMEEEAVVRLVPGGWLVLGGMIVGALLVLLWR
ncbi:tyrosine transporter [filamentous cyanobacterium LEGE 11480]|uniref:Tyrosine transporter n=1 Tax=Romeriopsis navalis LEGE 11480 TaxID=2777977 RepID=A0A928Z335_9CYAN|nr:aromatic amino acid transport family protein [Romeriopsis navalis]MBE9028773.1 tyrosine transporter [Romeriopsis navalis LEGE 11480]